MPSATRATPSRCGCGGIALANLQPAEIEPERITRAALGLRVFLNDADVVRQSGASRLGRARPWEPRTLLSSARVSLGVESKSLRESISNRRGALYCCRAWYTSSAEDGRATHGEINCDINIEFIGSEGHPFARLRPRGLRMPRAVSRGRASSDAPTYFPRSGVAPRHGPGTSSSFFPKCPLRRCTFRTNINYFRRGAAHEFSATADRDRALDNAASAPPRDAAVPDLSAELA